VDILDDMGVSKLSAIFFLNELFFLCLFCYIFTILLLEIIVAALMLLWFCLNEMQH